MPMGINEVRIFSVAGHWEVYVNGEFFCSADSYMEAVKELTAEYNV